MEKETNTPTLRFQGFDGPWEKKKLGDIGMAFDYGLNAAATDYDGRHKYLRITDIDDESRKFIVDNVTSPAVNFAVSEEYKLQERDIVFARTGASVGKTYLYDPLDGDVYFAGYLIRAHIKPEYDPSFVFQNTFTPSYARYIAITSQRSGQPGVNAQEYSAYEIYVPSLKEQCRVGTTLQKLDNVIEKQAQKIKKLEQFRQAMLTKLFPAEGASEPALRFHGFSGPWVKRGLLENFTKIIDFRGRTPKKLGMDWSANGYPALSALNVKDGYIDFSQDVHFGSPELYEKWMVGNELHRGQVIFTTEAPMGNVAQIPDERKYILSQRTIAFEVNPALLTEDFLATLLRSPKVQKDLQALSSGGTAKGVSQRSMEMVDVVLPANIEEQKKIGDFFHRLDLYISLQKEKLDKMRLLKAALLDKLFV